jgi:Tol biopolymer transport system component
MDGKGASTVLVREAHQYGNPRYSPDGRQIAISVQGLQSTNIFVYDIARNTFTKLTTEGINVRPEWTPDGKRILFRSERAGKVAIWWQPADGSAPAELLYAPDIEPYEAIMSPDAKWLIYRTAPGGKNSRDIFAVPLAGERVPVPLVTGPASETMPRLSPDGRWLAYQSNETGRFEVYVRPFPGAGARVQVSDEGGSEPLWGRSGRVLHYRRALGDVASVDVTTGASFSIGARRSALAGEYLTDPSHAAYDIAPDGRFLMLKRAGEESKTVVVYNWRRELREKLASVKK